MGHRVSGSDAVDSAALSRLAAPGRRSARRATTPRWIGDADVVAVSTAIPAEQPRGRRGPAAGAAGAGGGPRSWRPSAASAARVAVSGTHGKTTTSSMLALVLSEAGLRPVVHRRRRHRRLGLGRGRGTPGANGWWSRPTRATAPSWSWRRSGGGDQRRSRTTSTTTGRQAALASRVRRVRGRGTRARRRLRRRPRRRRAGRGSTGPPASTYGTSRAADVRIVDVELGGPSAAFSLVDRRADGRLGPAAPSRCPGCHNARNATGRRDHGPALGVPVGAARAGLGATGGWPGGSSAGARRGVTFIDDYAHLPGRGGGRAGRRPTTADGTGSCAVFQPHRYSRTEALWRAVRRRLRRADVLVVTDVYAAGEHPGPGSPAS